MTPPLRAVASIHDVRPDTLDRVGGLLDLLRPRAGTTVSLLVVPGLEWPREGLDRLRAWAEQGYELAGHGWVHEGPPRSLYHRLHALVISRDQAEHLSKSRTELIDLIARGRAWFGAQDLPEPDFYVPPAWAMGALDSSDLFEAGYRIAEVQWGFVELRQDRFLPAPLIGFETDTLFREVAVGVSNALNVRWARGSGRPLRVGLHPFDLELRRAGDLRRRITEPDAWISTRKAVVVLGGGIG